MVDAASSGSGVWISAALSSIGGFTTAVAGFLLLRVSDAKKDERTYQREKSARDDERRDKIIERRNEFQRITLIEIHRVAQRTLRSMGKMHHHDEMTTRDGVKWRTYLYPEAISNEAYETNIELIALTLRLRDANVRRLVTNLRDRSNRLGFCTSKLDADNILSETVEIFTEINEKISTALQKLDEVELSS